MADKVDFLGVGAARTGTTWIYQALKEHPEVCMSKTKEIHFFNKYHGFHKKNVDWAFNQKSIDWYLSHFEHCNPSKIKGEMDTRYLYERNALKLIKKTFPDVKIIVTLRNPIERAYSNYFYHLKQYPEQYDRYPTFEAMIEKEEEVLREGLYSDHLANCLEIFGRENILILFHSDLKKDASNYLRKIHQFLNIDKDFEPSFLKSKVNSSSQSSYTLSKLSYFLKKWTRPLPGNELLFSILRKSGLTNFIKSTSFIGAEKPDMKPKTRSRLQRYYRNDIKQIEELVDKDLSHWK